jgi:ferredoxin
MEEERQQLEPEEDQLPHARYYHSVRLNAGLCNGCTHCVRECPTEAIRVRFGKARINPLRCVDCGACIRVCPTHAKYARTDTLDELKHFHYNVAVPASSFAGQFKTSVPLDRIFSGLLLLGFDEVFEAALGGEVIALSIREYFRGPGRVRPAISSLCPAVVRLIQVRFPSLVSNIIPIEAPMDAAGKIVKLSRSRALGIPPEEIGVFFITGCPAKVTAVKQPVASPVTWVDGAISIADVYNRVMKNIEKTPEVPGIARASGSGLSWGAAGGENNNLGRGLRMAADGLNNVVRVLERGVGRLRLP